MSAPGVKGAQIDLVIRRANRVVTLCEMKSCPEQFSIDAKHAGKLREKSGAFNRETGTRGNGHLMSVTTYGLHRNAHSAMGQSEVVPNDLFRFRPRPWVSSDIPTASPASSSTSDFFPRLRKTPAAVIIQG